MPALPELRFCVKTRSGCAFTQLRKKRKKFALRHPRNTHYAAQINRRVLRSKTVAHCRVV